MGDLRDKIAGIVDEHALMNGVDYRGAADAILDAMPEIIAGMVKGLEWNGVEDDCFSTCEALGFSYEICVFDTLERSCDYVWQATAKLDSKQRWANAVSLPTPPRASFSDAKSAVDNHHRAQVTAALKFEGAFALEPVVNVNASKERSDAS